MLLEAQRRGYEIHYMEMNDLYLHQGVARARTPLTVGRQAGISSAVSRISRWVHWNVILMRKRSAI